jgi:hypothetical protein
MKHTKNSWNLFTTVFLIMTSLIISCSKKDSPPPVVIKPTVASFTPTSGFGGDTVVITGTNFTGATAVSFGGTPAASFTVTNATTIKAKLGNGASGSISVVTVNGTGTLAGFTFNSGLPPVDGFVSSNDVESASLIAHFPFDGNTKEAIHSANPVLVGGAQTYVAGKLGQAVHMDKGWLTYGPEATTASASNTPFNSNDTLQNGFTVSLWIQVPDTSLLTNLFQLSTPNIPNWPILGLAYRKHGDNSFDMDGGVGNVDGTGPHLTYASAFQQPAFMDTLAWAFLAMTYDPAGKTLKYYANGILSGTFNLATAGAFPDTTSALLMIAPNYATIGNFEGTLITPGDSGNAIPGFMSAGMTGNIDDIRFYNKTLSSQKLTDLFILGNQGR